MDSITPRCAVNITSKDDRSSFQLEAIRLWEIDRDALQKSDITAKDLGAALIKVKDSVPHGDYEPWLKQEGIKKNRALYCTRLALGKVQKAKDERAKQPKSTALKVGMRVEHDGETFLVKKVKLYNDKPLVLELEVAIVEHSDETVAEYMAQFPKPIEIPAEPGTFVTFKVAELKQCLDKLSNTVGFTSQESNGLLLRIFTDGGVVKLTGRDCDIVMTLKALRADADGQLDFLIEFPKLHKIVKALTSVEVTIKLQSTEALIGYQGFSANIPISPMTLDASALKPEGLEFETFNLQELNRHLSFIDFTVPLQTSKYVSNAALLDFKTEGILKVVGCDGKMLAVSSNPIESHSPDEILIQHRIIKLIRQMSGESIRIATAEQTQFFETDDELVTCNVLNSTFPPDWRRIIPKAGSHVSTVTFSDKDKLIAAVKRQRCSWEGYGGLKAVEFSLCDSKRQLTLETYRAKKRPDSASETYTKVSSEVLKVDGAGETFTVEIDADRLLPFLERAIFPVTLYYRSSDTALDFHANGGTPDNATDRFVLMPLRGERQKAMAAQVATAEPVTLH